MWTSIWCNVTISLSPHDQTLRGVSLNQFFLESTSLLRTSHHHLRSMVHNDTLFWISNYQLWSSWNKPSPITQPQSQDLKFSSNHRTVRVKLHRDGHPWHLRAINLLERELYIASIIFMVSHVLSMQLHLSFGSPLRTWWLQSKAIIYKSASFEGWHFAIAKKRSTAELNC